jgi:hypothetical protein
MMEFDPSYDSEEAYAVMPSSFHDIRDVEFQEGGGQQGRGWRWHGGSGDVARGRDSRCTGDRAKHFGGSWIAGLHTNFGSSLKIGV